MEGPLVWLVLARAEQVGRVRLSHLIETCPDPADAWQLTAADFMQIDGWNWQAAQGAVAARKSAEVQRAAEAEWAAACKVGLRMVTLLDPDYPFRLRMTLEPPPYFYQAGPWLPDARPVLAIVGTRRPTAYGLAVAEKFGYELAQLGAVIVSGMARGVDCAAHRGALRAGGSTVAVLGGGADVCYPREAAGLYRAIRATGAIISEQEPGAAPRREHFPERNRIISGMADCIIVVEAGEHSGTSLTVDAALKQSRQVFAVPGPITSPMSIGPNQLILDGATMVVDARHILEQLQTPWRIERPPQERAMGLDPNQAHMLGWMGSGPRTAGDLAEAWGLSAADVQSRLTMLELKGLVRQLPGGQYVRIG